MKSIFAHARASRASLLILLLLLSLVPDAALAQSRASKVGAARGKVILVSFDGLAYHMWQSDPVTRELRAIRRTAARGVTARGMIQAFPSITPASHAALWTGAYGNTSGIITSGNPILPRSEHSAFDRKSGFNAELLRAEPVWAAAARQGVRVVAHEATQNYPFVPITTASGTATPPLLASGYGPPELESDEALGAKDVTPEDPNVWSGLPRSSLPVRAFRWKIKNITLHGALVAERSRARGYTAMYVAADPRRERVRVAPHATESVAPRGRALARYFSEPLLFHATERRLPVAAYFRLFELSADGSDFLFYQAAIHEFAIYDGTPSTGQLVERLLKEAGGFIGNGASYTYRDGKLGKQIYAGGNGTAERRYLESIELIIRQLNRHTSWFWKKYSPELLVDYCPYPDEMDHTWYGLARPDVTGVDRAIARRIQEFRRWGYMAVDARAELLERLAGPRGHIIYVSDHGMSPMKKEVRINEILRRAGLYATDGEGKLDRARTRAIHLKLSIQVNTEDWRGGIVPLGRRNEVVDRIEQVLKEVRDPETGQAVFTQFFRPEEYEEKYGIGGPAGGDLYFELAPGYYPSDRPGDQVIANLRVPDGAHGFLPTRPEMLASFIARGPGLQRGILIPTIRSIQVAPFVSDLLGIKPPAQTRARSPFRSEAGADPSGWQK
jgi:hypothetical protein